MKDRHKISFVIAMGLSLVMLAGCAGGQSANVAVTEKNTQSEDTGKNTQIKDTGKNTQAKDSGNEAENSNIAKTETVEIIEPQKAGEVINSDAIEAMGVANLFYSSEISPDIQNRIMGSSYQENEDIALSELRYLRVLYYGFDGETHIGEMIVNEKIAQDVLEIMQELYENQYPIEKMVLIDEYNADDEAAMEDNNTSAFNYRKINGSTKLSKHSMGLAIDINPRFNPCVKTINGALSVEPINGEAYTDRTQEFPYKITKEDLCYQLFIEHGFTWGGSWNSLKDYQHFEKDI
ncbi:M15 family metallopeptidase [Roseburia sp. MSJ-14]|uniref:M15 family metallopeptidase n=1 Tax=Roseburia sp. MSJ-14 TaxID=2841514 RepID=UPI0020A108A4|nr:M15 family metallopeptidase [Roseburia sp. MSJ-14]